MFINAFRAWSNEQMLSLLLTMDKDPQAGIALFNQYRFFWILNIWRPDNLTSSAVLTGTILLHYYTGVTIGVIGQY